MKKIDFTKPGGFPLTQDQLGYLQSAYTEMVNALAGVGGNITGPLVVSGMSVSEPAPGDIAVTDGWFAYNGELIKFTGGTVTPGGDVAMVLITSSGTPLTYNDGSTPNVILEKTGSLIAAASVTDATHFPILDMVPFGRELEWQLESLYDVGDPSVEGDVYYKKSNLTNELLIKGALYGTTISACAGLPSPAFYEAMQLPVGYRPLSPVPFLANFKNVFGSIPVTDGLVSQYITQLNCMIDTDGKLLIEWLLDDGSAPAGYWIEFNVRVGLD